MQKSLATLHNRSIPVNLCKGRRRCNNNVQSSITENTLVIVSLVRVRVRDSEAIREAIRGAIHDAVHRDSGPSELRRD